MRSTRLAWVVSEKEGHNTAGYIAFRSADRMVCGIGVGRMSREGGAPPSFPRDQVAMESASSDMSTKVP